jgi:hypothetical protein
MSKTHLIRFRTKKAHRDGLMAVLGVPGLEAVGLPDYRMVVWDEHIRALEQAKVPFEYLSKTAPNGPDSAAPRSS